MKSFSRLIALMAILVVLFATVIPVQAAQPLPTTLNFQVAHSLVATPSSDSMFAVSVSGNRGTVDLVRTVVSGSPVSDSITLSRTPAVFSSTGSGDGTFTGATLDSGGATVVWSGYNIRYLPCQSGLPTIKFTHNGRYIVTVTNPTGESMWVSFTSDAGATFSPWAEVGPNSTKTFADQPSAASGYISHVPALGQNSVCANIGWNFTPK